MQERKFKSIKISETTHTILKEYCFKNNLKLTWWVDSIIKKEMEKSSDNLQNDKSNKR